MNSIGLVVIIGFLVYGTFVGLFRSWKNGDRGWFAGILVAWVGGIGWAVGWVYIWRHKKPAKVSPPVVTPGHANTAQQPVPPIPPPFPADAEMVAPDWYADPRGEKRLRYFDGSQWTEHTSD
jgi:hypothetical protein